MPCIIFQASNVRTGVELVRPPRLERGTPGLEGRCSIQLSYGRTVWKCQCSKSFGASCCWAFVKEPVLYRIELPVCGPPGLMPAGASAQARR